MRIEKEQLAAGKAVVHGYGTGGRGYELSWGIAQEISALVKEHVGTISSPSAKL